MHIIIGFILLAAVIFFLYAHLSEKKTEKTKSNWFWNVVIVIITFLLHPYLMIGYCLIVFSAHLFIAVGERLMK